MANAAKEKYDSDALTTMLENYNTVVAAKGKKILTFKLKDADLEEVLGVIMGRSGNLRAPTIARGKKLVVGFNEDMYDAELA